MTDLEKYIINNKEGLEPNTVNPRIWLGIENELLKSKARRRTLYLKWASIAAVFLLACALFGGGLWNKSGNIDQELIEVYGYQSYQFAQQVHNKKSVLSKAKIPAQHLEDFQVLLQQLEFLDEQYQDYLKYIEDNGYQSFIGDQLLNYYQSKIDLMDRIQHEIEKINYYENKFPSNDEQVGLQI